MKHQEAEKLESGQKVMHNRYGECIVKEVIMSFGELFGVVITPTTEPGRKLLSFDTGTDIPDLLEEFVRKISVENKPGEKPLDHKTVWGIPESELPEQEPKDYFAPESEGVPE